MHLIERYVNEVGRRLARKQQDDVRAELRSLLQDTLEDRVEGTPTEDDVVTLLKEFGRPEDVAASYRPSNQYLIGPELFPAFKKVIGIVLAALTLGLTIAMVLSLVTKPVEAAGLGEALLSFLGALYQAALGAFGMVVIIFAILQRVGVRPDEPDTEWDPRSLPEIDAFNEVKLGETIVGVAFGVLFLVVLNLFSDRIGIVIFPGGKVLLNNVLRANLLLINISLLLGLGLNVVLLWRRRWHWYTRLAKVLIDVFGVAVFYRLAMDVSMEEAALVAAGLPDPLPAMLTQMGMWIVGVVAFLLVFDAAKVGVKYLRQTSVSFPLGGGEKNA